MDGDNIANPRTVSILTFAGDHGGLAGASVVGDFENGAQVNHGCLLKIE
jgi:hypothetical protein